MIYGVITAVFTDEKTHGRVVCLRSLFPYNIFLNIFPWYIRIHRTHILRAIEVSHAACK